MYRAGVILLLLAGVVLAGPETVTDAADAWKERWWGEDPGLPGLPDDDPDKPTENHSEMTAIAGATASMVGAYLAAYCTALDQENSAEDEATAWFGLKFVGTPVAVDPKWKIWTRICGGGEAYAGSDSNSGVWCESYQLIQITGDNQNVCAGVLAVESGGDAGMDLSIPAAIPELFRKSRRRTGEDQFAVTSSQRSAGAGTCCRIKVENQAKATGRATSGGLMAWTRMMGNLRVSIEMIGTCRIAGITVTDRFILTGKPSDAFGDGGDEGCAPPDPGKLWTPLTPEELAIMEDEDKEAENREAEGEVSPGAEERTPPETGEKVEPEDAEPARLDSPVEEQGQ